jgi:hypothetical protein
LSLPPARERGAVKGVDGAAIVAGNCDVNNALEPAFASDPEVGLAVFTEPGSRAATFGSIGRDLHDQRIAERRQRLAVERLRSFVIRRDRS